MSQRNDRNKVEKSIREFHYRVTEIERVTDVLSSVLSMTPECELYSGIWALIGGYRDALGASYSVDGWLDWWWMECRLGLSPLRASPAGGELRMVSTIDDFVKLVLDDLKLTNLKA
jgi:hypothetical protein